MAIFASQNGVATVNLNDRLSPLPFKHAAMAYGLRYDAGRRVFIPATEELTVFQAGPDDNAATRYVQSGYRDGTGSNSVDLSSGYKGGAWSITDPVQALSMAVVPSGTVRIIRASDVDTTNVKTPAFPRRGGRITALRDQASDFWGAMFDDLWSAVAYASQSMVLPPGNDTMCAPFAGLFRFLREKDRAVRPNAPSGYHRFGCEVFCEPNLRNMGDFQPNRILFDFRGGVSEVALRDGIPAPNDGDYAVIDMDVRVEVAHVEFSKDRKSYEGVDESDKIRLAAWMDAKKNDGDPSLPPLRSSFNVDQNVIRASHVVADFQRRLARIASGEDTGDANAAVADFRDMLAEFAPSAR